VNVGPALLGTHVLELWHKYHALQDILALVEQICHYLYVLLLLRINTPYTRCMQLMIMAQHVDKIFHAVVEGMIQSL
jgi:hypothetical protein